MKKDDIFNPKTWTEQDREFLDIAMKLNSEQKLLLIEVMELIENRPDRMDFALSWKGKARDLPAALAAI